jgi:RNA polymerase sigma-70 factor, ECF subfamily
MGIEAAGELQPAALSDEEIVERILGGETALFELLMRRHNQRLYRVTRAIVGDAGEAEDVTQDAYVRAFEHLNQFAGRARFSTWLTRIAVHEASARLRRRGRQSDIEDTIPTFAPAGAGPEQRVADHELGQVIEAAVGALPRVYRSVFMLREVEGLSTAETAACLEINGETVKTRLHRARALLRNHITARIGATVRETFEFAGARCDRTVAAVMARITSGHTSPWSREESDERRHDHAPEGRALPRQGIVQDRH